VSLAHPVVAVTGSSGAGTSTVTETFAQIFAREGITSAVVHGDSYHRYDRVEMQRASAAAVESGAPPLSTLGRRRTVRRSAGTVREYGRRRGGEVRNYVHDATKAAEFGFRGHLHPWQDVRRAPTCCTRGLTVRSHDTSTSQARRPADRGGADHQPGVDSEGCTDIAPNAAYTRGSHRTILRRMPDYVHYICPQYPTPTSLPAGAGVDTSNPFIAGWIPPWTNDGVDTVRGPRGTTSPTCGP